MSLSIPSAWRWALVVGATLLAAIFSLSRASAQIPSPPTLVFGSVTDSAGVVPENLPVVAYIGDKECGTQGGTQFTGEGAARVTVYWITVISDSQIAGCGKPDSEIRIKIGDRFAPQTAKWSTSGVTQVNVTFGNATPAAIPTFTPAPKPTNAPSTGTNAQGTPVPGAANTTAQPAGTIPAGSPGAGSPYPTLKGGITNTNANSTGGSGGGDGGGGFPLWGVALAVLGGIAVIGGGVGYAMSRANRDDDLEDTFPPPPPAPDTD
jgi:hypothetical protein